MNERQTAFCSSFIVPHSLFLSVAVVKNSKFSGWITSATLKADASLMMETPFGRAALAECRRHTSDGELFYRVSVRNVNKQERGNQRMMEEMLKKRLPARWRAPFERSYGWNFEHVSVVTGRMIDEHLAKMGALALAFDGATIMLSSKLRAIHARAQFSIIGHELAHTVQLARKGTDATESLEAEAWRAARAALRGERYAVLGRAAHPLAVSAVALYLFDSAKDYFETFGLDNLDIPKGKTDKINPATYEKLLDLMIKWKDEKNLVLQAHGSSLGWGISVIDKQDEPYATTRNLNVMRGIVQLSDAITAAGDDFDKLKALCTKHNVLLPPTNVDEAKQKIKEVLDKQKSDLKLTDEAAIRRVVGKMDQVKAIKRDRIELRSCNMGILQPTLDFFRSEYNTTLLRAPDQFSLFGWFLPPHFNISSQAYTTFIKKIKIKYFTYKMTSGTFAFAYKGLPHAQAELPGAADNNLTVKDFAKAKMSTKELPDSKVKMCPTHFLLTDPPAFEKEKNYTDHLQQSPAKPSQQKGGGNSP